MNVPEPYRAASYDYELPEALIAQHPTQRRDGSRLLRLQADGAISHHTFVELPELLRPGDLIVANDTKVLRARFRVRRAGGGTAEVLLLKPATNGAWEALVRPGARIRPGDALRLTDDACIRVLGADAAGTRLVRFEGTDPDAAMNAHGLVPLPPYVRQPPSDAEARYQTVYAATPGSVAAPTAGLHFTLELLAALAARGIGWTTITLDVGAGTFRPVRHQDVREHAMHAERYAIGASAAKEIARARDDGRRVVAVGTTVVRALEDAARRGADGLVGPAERVTDIFIYPPYRFRVVDALITNFHLPRSSLLMLVAAFAGTDRVLRAYHEAIVLEYRFYSFGDAMLVERP